MIGKKETSRTQMSHLIVSVLENFQPLKPPHHWQRKTLLPLPGQIQRCHMRSMLGGYLSPQVLYFLHSPAAAILCSITEIRSCPGINRESLSLVWNIHEKSEEPLCYVMAGHLWEYSWNDTLSAVQNIRQDNGDLLKPGQSPVIQNSVFSQGPVMSPWSLETKVANKFNMPKSHWQSAEEGDKGFKDGELQKRVLSI